VNLTRELYRLGCRLSGGIAHEHDSDEKLWANLGIESVRVGAFSRISDDDIGRAARLVDEADVTVLCSFPVGPGNLGNLRLAARARRLVILRQAAEDTARTFFSPEGETLFRKLSDRARTLGYQEIVDEIERSLLVDPPAGGNR
jgi:iron complex transport system ATP-binding protein